MALGALLSTTSSYGGIANLQKKNETKSENNRKKMIFFLRFLVASCDLHFLFLYYYFL